MFPYRDDNPTVLPPYVTIGIIALNVIAWLFVQGAGSPGPLAHSVCDYGLIPGELLHTAAPGASTALGPGMICVVDAQANYLTIVTSMFMHGGWLHLIGNMWFFGSSGTTSKMRWGT